MSVEGLGLPGKVPFEMKNSVTLIIEGVGEVEITDLTGKNNEEELINLLASKSRYLQELCRDLLKNKIITKGKTKITLSINKKGDLDFSMKLNKIDVDIEKKLAGHEKHLSEMKMLMSTLHTGPQNFSRLDSTIAGIQKQRKTLEAIKNVQAKVAPGKPLLRKEKKEIKQKVRWMEEGEDRPSKLRLATVGPDVYQKRAFYKERMDEKENIPPVTQMAEKESKAARAKSAWEERNKPRRYREGGIFPTESALKDHQEQLAKFLGHEKASDMQKVAEDRAHEFAKTLALLKNLDDIDPLECTDEEVLEIASNFTTCWTTLNDPQFAFFCENNGKVYAELLNEYDSKMTALRILSEHPEFKKIQPSEWETIKDTIASLSYLEQSGYAEMVPSRERDFFDTIYKLGRDWIEELGGDASNQSRQRFSDCFAKLEARGLTSHQEINNLDPIDFTLEGLKEIHGLLTEISKLGKETKDPLAVFFQKRYSQYFSESFKQACEAKIAEFGARIKAES